MMVLSLNLTVTWFLSSTAVVVSLWAPAVVDDEPVLNDVVSVSHQLGTAGTSSASGAAGPFHGYDVGSTTPNGNGLGFIDEPGSDDVHLERTKTVPVSSTECPGCKSSSAGAFDGRRTPAIRRCQYDTVRIAGAREIRS